MTRLLAYVRYEDVRVKIFEGRALTVEQSKSMSDRDLMIIYRTVTSDAQPITYMEPVRRVVAGQLDIDWHEINEIGVSEKMGDNQKRRVEKAAATANDPQAAENGGTAAPKAPRKSIKNLICGMLIEAETDPSITDEVITAAIQANFPNNKAASDSKLHINYYRSQLGRQGKIAKRARAVKAKKQKAATEGAQAETVDVAEA